MKYPNKNTVSAVCFFISLTYLSFLFRDGCAASEANRKRWRERSAGEEGDRAVCYCILHFGLLHLPGAGLCCWDYKVWPPQHINVLIRKKGNKQCTIKTLLSSEDLWHKMSLNCSKQVLKMFLFQVAAVMEGHSASQGQGKWVSVDSVFV